MKLRLLNCLTFFLSLLIPVLGVVWVRSYLQNDTFVRMGNGYVTALDCIRGEVSFWIQPWGDGGETRWRRETVDSGYGVKAAELFAQQPGARSRWFAGFGYAEAAPIGPGGVPYGTMRCFVTPIWFVMFVIGLVPALRLLNHVRVNQLGGERAGISCRRCGAELAPDQAKCGYCSFPAFVRKGSVA